MNRNVDSIKQNLCEDGSKLYLFYICFDYCYVKNKGNIILYDDEPAQYWFLKGKSIITDDWKSDGILKDFNFLLKCDKLLKKIIP